MKTKFICLSSVFIILSQIAVSQKLEPIGSVTISNSPIAITFTPGGQELLVSTSAKELVTISVKDLKVTNSKAMPAKIKDLSYSPDGKYFGFLSSKLYVYDAATDKQLGISKKGGMQSFAFVGGGIEEAVVTFPKPGKLMILDNKTQSVTHEFNNIYSYNIWKDVDVSHDGQEFLVVNNLDVFVYDYIAKGNTLRRFQKPNDKEKFWHKAKFSPDKSIIMALVGMHSKYPSIEFYDRDSEKKIGDLPVSNRGNKSGDIDFAISSDGKKIAVCNSKDNLIRLWDISSLYQLTEHHKMLAEKKKAEEAKAAEQAKANEANVSQQQLQTIMAKIDALNNAPAATAALTKNNLCKETDLDIPVTEEQHPLRFALIIGNEDYSSYQTGLESEVNVDYAVNDAKVFKEYMIKTLGIPENNVTLLENATAGQMNQALSKFNKIIEYSNGQAEVFFYYSGHGLPDENTKESYIMPVDVSGFTLQYAIKVDDVYKKLTQHPSKKVTVFMDACFSGGSRNEGLVAVKGVKIVPKEGVIKGNIVIFTSSSGDESSQVYKEKYHGMFTYHLLKKLKETKGDITYQQLSDYLNSSIKLQSVIINNKVQTPTTNISSDIIDTWGDWKLK